MIQPAPAVPAPTAASAPQPPRPPSDPQVVHNRQRLREVHHLADQIAELSAHITAADWRLLTKLREFDKRQGWNDYGARSCAHWLHWRTGLNIGAAREKVRVATRVATPDTEKELIDIARAATTSQVETLVRHWRRATSIDWAQITEQRHAERGVAWHWDDQGMLVVSARLEPEAGAVLVRALEAAQEQLFRESRSEEPQPTVDQKRADALGLIAEAALGRGLDQPCGRDRFQVVVHVDAESLRREGERNETTAALLEDDVDVSAETCRRLACDTSCVEVTHSGPAAAPSLDVGRKTRTIPPAIRRALEHRDRGCRFPGCHLKPGYCDAHHIRHWADGGETRLDNLVLLCCHHHRRLHEDGFLLERHPDGTLTFRTPRGLPLPAAPPPPPILGDPIAALVHDNHQLGLAQDPDLLFINQEGGPCDYTMALDYFLSPRSSPQVYPDRSELDVSAETSNREEPVQPG